MSRAIPFDWHGERFEALADKALWHPATKSLLVADLHLGKGEHYRQMALPLPPGTTARTLQRLSQLLSEWPCERLLILGDLWHSTRGVQGTTLDDFSCWARSHSQISLGLVRGNHDRTIQHPNIPDLEGPRLGQIQLCHEPDPAAAIPNLGGHIHPAVRLSGRGRASLRVPCFWFAANHGVLPAFGEFTGTYVVSPAPDDRIFVVANGSVIEPRKQ